MELGASEGVETVAAGSRGRIQNRVRESVEAAGSCSGRLMAKPGRPKAAGTGAGSRKRTETAGEDRDELEQGSG